MAVASSPRPLPCLCVLSALYHPDVTVGALLTPLPRPCSPRLHRQPVERTCVVGARAPRLGRRRSRERKTIAKQHATCCASCVIHAGPTAAPTLTPSRKQDARQGGDVPAKPSKVPSFLLEADPPHGGAGCLCPSRELAKGSECVPRAVR